MMMVLGSSRVFQVVFIENFFSGAPNMVCLDHLDKLFAMVCSDSSLEILLYGKISNILHDK
jgi:hypothetical protein